MTAGGKNVAPQKIEGRLRADPRIAEAVVIGDGRPYLVALLTLDPEDAPCVLGIQGWLEAARSSCAQNPA